jgi:hypothetical protein
VDPHKTKSKDQFHTPVHVDEGEEVEAERGSEPAEQGPGEKEGVGVTLVVGGQVVVVQHAHPAQQNSYLYTLKSNRTQS